MKYLRIFFLLAIAFASANAIESLSTESKGGNAFVVINSGPNTEKKFYINESEFIVVKLLKDQILLLEATGEKSSTECVVDVFVPQGTNRALGKYLLADITSNDVIKVGSVTSREDLDLMYKHKETLLKISFQHLDKIQMY